MKIISIFNQKGGVGKTTTNINLAAGLAMKKKKVLTIDMDPQGNTTSGLGIDKHEQQLSTYDLLLGDTPTKELIQPIEKVPGLFIIPSSMDLASADIELSQREHREKVLAERLKEIESEQFDFVLLDCPPSLGLLSINALTASDSVIIPMQSEFYALEGISHLLATIDRVNQGLNKNLMIEGVLLVMYDPRKNLHLEVARELKQHFGDQVYHSTIPQNVRLAEAPSFGVPVFQYDPKCKGAEAFKDLVNEFLKKNKEK
ncbi:MAG: ParA family protein [Clostridium sp.]|nr:ParA family protein [Clostridium sp.]